MEEEEATIVRKGNGQHEGDNASFGRESIVTVNVDDLSFACAPERSRATVTYCLGIYRGN